MRWTPFSKSVGALAAIALFVAPAAVFAVPAHADEMQEYYFFKYLDENGVPYSKKMDAVRMAKSTCLQIGRPGNPGLIGYRAAYDLKQGMDLTDSEAEKFIEASIYVYCPSVWGIEQES